MSPIELDARYRGPLMSYFLKRTSSREEAEDLTQQVFLRLLSAKGVESHAGYVFTCASNLLKDRTRSFSRRVEHISLDDAPEETHEVIELDPERIVCGRQEAARVLATLDKLGERTRDMFILFRLEGLRQAEIARLYGCTRDNVEKHVAKATKALMRKYGRERAIGSRKHVA